MEASDLHELLRSGSGAMLSRKKKSMEKAQEKPKVEEETICSENITSELEKTLHSEKECADNAQGKVCESDEVCVSDVKECEGECKSDVKECEEQCESDVKCETNAQSKEKSETSGTSNVFEKLFSEIFDGIGQSRPRSSSSQGSSSQSKESSSQSEGSSSSKESSGLGAESFWKHTMPVLLNLASKFLNEQEARKRKTEEAKLERLREVKAEKSAAKRKKKEKKEAKSALDIVQNYLHTFQCIEDDKTRAICFVHHLHQLCKMGFGTVNVMLMKEGIQSDGIKSRVAELDKQLSNEFLSTIKLLSKC